MSVPVFRLSGAIRNYAWPPRKGKPVVAQRPFLDSRIEWVHIDSLTPSASHESTWSRQMTPSQDKYPALVVEILGDKNIINDGHHRYWTLRRGGWSDTVPVIRIVYRRKNRQSPQHQRRHTMTATTFSLPSAREVAR